MKCQAAIRMGNQEAQAAAQASSRGQAQNHLENYVNDW